MRVIVSLITLLLFGSRVIAQTDFVFQKEIQVPLADLPPTSGNLNIFYTLGVGLAWNQLNEKQFVYAYVNNHRKLEIEVYTFNGSVFVKSAGTTKEFGELVPQRGLELPDSFGLADKVMNVVFRGEYIAVQLDYHAMVSLKVSPPKIEYLKHVDISNDSGLRFRFLVPSPDPVNFTHVLGWKQSWEKCYPVMQFDLNIYKMPLDSPLEMIQSITNFDRTMNVDYNGANIAEVYSYNNNTYFLDPIFDKLYCHSNLDGRVKPIQLIMPDSLENNYDSLTRLLDSGVDKAISLLKLCPSHCNRGLIGIQGTDFYFYRRARISPTRFLYYIDKYKLEEAGLRYNSSYDLRTAIFSTGATQANWSSDNSKLFTTLCMNRKFLIRTVLNSDTFDPVSGQLLGGDMLKIQVFKVGSE